MRHDGVQIGSGFIEPVPADAELTQLQKAILMLIHEEDLPKQQFSRIAHGIKRILSTFDECRGAELKMHRERLFAEAMVRVNPPNLVIK